MIIRGKRNTNYTILSNVGLEDSRLPFRAKGLLAYLLSKPDGWSVSDRHLATVGPDGRDAVQTALRDLEKHGYLVRRRENGAGGKWIHHSYIYDEPQSTGEAAGEAAQTMAGKTSHGSTMVGKTVHGSTVHGKPRHIVSTEVVSTDQANTEVVKTEGEGESAPAANGADATHPPSQPASDGAEKQHRLTPDPSPSGEGKKTPTPQQEMFQALCDAVGWDPALLTVEQRGQVGQTMAALQKAGYTLDEVRRFRPEVWAMDWRWTKNKSYPTLNQVRSEIAKVRKTESRGGSGQGGNSGGDNRLSEEDVAAIRRQREERRRQRAAADDQDARDVSDLFGDRMGDAGRATVGRSLEQGDPLPVQA